MRIRKKKITNYFKNIVLIFLFLLLLLLIFQSLTYGINLNEVNSKTLGNVITQLFSGSINQQSSINDNFNESAYPVKIAVGQTPFELYAISYNDTTSLYENCQIYLEEALETSTTFVQISPQEYMEKLYNPLIFMEYDGIIPLTLIASWLDVQIDETDIAPITLTIVNTTVGQELIVRDANTFNLYKTNINLSDSFDDFIKSLAPNGYSFAVTDTELSKVFCAETLIYNNLITYPAIIEETPAFASGGENLQNILEAFNYSVYTAKSYTTDDNSTIVFGENFSTLSADNAGNIIFSASAEKGAISASKGDGVATSLEQKIALAKDILLTVIHGFNENEQVNFINYEIAQDGNTEYIVFSNSINGISVNNTNQNFAVFEFSNDKLIYAQISVKKYSNMYSINLMDERQVAALATQNAQGLLTISYENHNDGGYIPSFNVRYPKTFRGD